MASSYAVEEARRNLAAKGPADSLQAFNAVLADVTLVAEARAPALESAAAAALTDPADVPILAAAIQSSADVLVTGDRRAFGRFFRATFRGIEILMLRDAIRRVLSLPLD